jgi:hypothetical protein
MLITEVNRPIIVNNNRQLYKTGRPSDRGSIPGRDERIFPVASVSRPALGPTQPPVQLVPGVFSPGVKRGRGVTLTTHHHVVPRSWLSRSYTSFPPSASMACSRTALIIRNRRLGIIRIRRLLFINSIKLVEISRVIAVVKNTWNRYSSFTLNLTNNYSWCEISSSHGGEYDVQSCLLGYTAV